MSVESFFGHHRAQAAVNELAPFILPGNRVIDIGAGGCRVAEHLMRVSGVEVTPIDVVDHNLTDLPLEIYDGKKLPYPSKSFDISLLVFVLHHATDFAATFSEAQRVSKDRIIIIEDTPQTSFERFAWRKLDYYGNHAQHPDVNIAHGTKSPEEWKAFFETSGSSIQYSYSFRRPYLSGGLYPHTLFVLNAASS